MGLFLLLLGVLTSTTAQLAEAFQRNVDTAVGIAVLLAFALFAAYAAGLLSGGLILFVLMLLTSDYRSFVGWTAKAHEGKLVTSKSR